jgi:hypothetical protein
MIGAAIGAGFMIGGITLITQRSRLSSDTAIGLLFIGKTGEAAEIALGPVERISGEGEPRASWH